MLKILLDGWGILWPLDSFSREKKLKGEYHCKRRTQPSGHSEGAKWLGFWESVGESTWGGMVSAGQGRAQRWETRCSNGRLIHPLDFSVIYSASKRYKAFVAVVLFFLCFLSFHRVPIYLPPVFLGILEPTPCPKVSNSCPDNSLLSWPLSKTSTISTKTLCEVIAILIHAISSPFFLQTDPSKLEVIWSTSHPYSFLFMDTPWPWITENQACLRPFSHQWMMFHLPPMLIKTSHK